MSIVKALVGFGAHIGDAETLDTLPEYTVILDAHQEAHQKFGGFWYSPGCRGGWKPGQQHGPHFPVRVLHLGENNDHT